MNVREYIFQPRFKQLKARIIFFSFFFSYFICVFVMKANYAGVKKKRKKKTVAGFACSIAKFI